jgi:hypothetical protein
MRIAKSKTHRVHKLIRHSVKRYGGKPQLQPFTALNVYRLPPVCHTPLRRRFRDLYIHPNQRKTFVARPSYSIHSLISCSARNLRSRAHRAAASRASQQQQGRIRGSFSSSNLENAFLNRIHNDACIDLPFRLLPKALARVHTTPIQRPQQSRFRASHFRRFARKHLIVKARFRTASATRQLHQ